MTNSKIMIMNNNDILEVSASKLYPTDNNDNSMVGKTIIALDKKGSLEQSKNNAISFSGNFIKSFIGQRDKKRKNEFSNNNLTDQIMYNLQPTFIRSPLGDIYCNDNAMDAYKNNQLISKDIYEEKGNSKIRLLFINQTNRDLILCWVGFDRKLHHYYKLKPWSGATITGGLGSRSKNLSIDLEGSVHTEHSFLGHQFVIGTCPSNDDHSNHYYYDGVVDDDDEANEKEEDQTKTFCFPFFKLKDKRNKKVDNMKTILDKTKINKIVAAYRPIRRVISANDILDDDDDDDDDENLKSKTNLHLVTITEELGFMPNSNTPQLLYHLSVTQCKLDSTPLDTSKKVYDKLNWSGWTVHCEEGLFSYKSDKSESSMSRDDTSNCSSATSFTRTEIDDILLERFQKRFQLDLAAATKKLPKHACEKLKKTTSFWINRSQKYGPRLAPIRGTGMCFHPYSEWLIRNGMSEDKCGDIELYQADEYLDDCDFWHGKGGVLIHELSHAL